MITKVVVSRKWAHPQIEAFVSQESVGATMELDAFLTAVVAEIGNPTLLLTEAALGKAVKAAGATVLQEMKSTTRYVV